MMNFIKKNYATSKKDMFIYILKDLFSVTDTLDI